VHVLSLYIIIILRQASFNQIESLIKVTINPHPVTLGENRVSAHDATDTDDAPTAVFADDQRRIPKLTWLLQRTGLQVSGPAILYSCYILFFKTILSII